MHKWSPHVLSTQPVQEILYVQIPACVRQVCTCKSVRTDVYVRVCTRESVHASLYMRVCMYEPVHRSLYVRVCTRASVLAICAKLWKDRALSFFVALGMEMPSMCERCAKPVFFASKDPTSESRQHRYIKTWLFVFFNDIADETRTERTQCVHKPAESFFTPISIKTRYISFSKGSPLCPMGMYAKLPLWPLKRDVGFHAQSPQ